MAARLKDTIALVTGAGGGIGTAVCRRLAAEGARVAASDRDRDSCADLAAEIGGLALALDVSSLESIDRALVAVSETLGPVRVLVNNAGVEEYGRFADSDERLWDRLWSVNLRGVLAVTHAVLPVMRAAGGGAIVNMASEAGRVGAHSQAVYSATKGGVIAFGKALAREEARHGITVNAVAPGPVQTALMEAAREHMGEQRMAAALRAIPIGRAGTAEEVAAAVAFLASPDAAYITGATLPVSGGLAMV
jgi:2-hydroxycyclohexanecarboxyl-CoA dehydrogenase